MGSAMKENKQLGASTSTFQLGGENKKKAINFGDSSADNTSYIRPPMAKDAPTIGNALMMKMEF